MNDAKFNATPYSLNSAKSVVVAFQLLRARENSQPKYQLGCTDRGCQELFKMR